MKLLRSLCSCALFTLLVTGLSARAVPELKRITPVPADQPIPVADFFRLPQLANPKLNRAGTHFAALLGTDDDTVGLLVYDLESNKSERLHGFGNRDIYSVDWLDNKRVIYSLARDKLYSEGLLAADVGRLGSSYPLLQLSGMAVVSIPEHNQLRPWVWIQSDAYNEGRDGGVVQLNSQLNTGPMTATKTSLTQETYQLARDNSERHVLNTIRSPGGGKSVGYLADKDGEPAFATTNKDGVYTLHRLAGGEWQKCNLDLDYTDVVDYGEKSGEIVALTPGEASQPYALRFMDAASGKPGDLVLQDKAYDFNGWLYHHPVSKNILGAVFEKAGPQVIWFDAGYKTIQKILDGFFPGQIARIIGSNIAETRFFIRVYSDRQPTSYYLVDLEKRTRGLIQHSAPWIDTARMQTMNIMKFKTRDGRTLDAYVTMPAGATKQNPPPLVVLPHGGPWARDYWGYNGEVQFLASRGYAVLQPNYRGSTGTNWMFTKSEQWNFRQMHDDVTDATRMLVRSGLVDAGRVGIMGTSFGGYLASCGAAFEPGLYRCAVSIAGISDWENMLKDTKYNQFDDVRFSVLKRRLGEPGRESQKFSGISPLRHLASVKIPFFVAHGKDDPIAPLTESRNLIAELSRYGIPHETMIVNEEGHGMQNLDNRVELYERIEAFLAKNLMAK